MELGISKKRFLFFFIPAFTIASIYIVKQMTKADNWKLPLWTERINDTDITEAVLRENKPTLPPPKKDQGSSARENYEFENISKECPKLSLPRLNGYSDHWQNVSANKSHFVYSAYVDGTTLRLVGATLSIQSQTEPMFCQVWHKMATAESSPEKSILQNPLITDAKIEVIQPSNGKRYIAAFFKCPFPKDILPQVVSLVTGNRCQSPLNHLVIAEPSTKKYKFAVCVKPTHGNFSNDKMLVEFLELNRILGAENFVFYDTSIAPNVQKVLDMYINQGIAERIPWKMPINNIITFGQVSCINDCLYRKRHNAEYIVFTDLDEFLIPRKPKDKTWTDMLAGLPDAGAYIFRNTFFPMSWPDSNVSVQSWDDIVKRHRISTLLKFDRENVVYPSGLRSKYFVKAAAADTVQIHVVAKMRKPWESFTLDPDVGLSHHYRHWPQAKLKEKTRDRTVLKYRDDLISKVTESWKRIQRES